MSIRSVGSTITNALESVSSTKSTSATSATTRTSGTAEDASTVSGPAKLLSKLKELQKSDPAKFKEVMTKISDSLKEKAAATDDAGDKKVLTEMASKFQSAGETGDLSALAPPKGGHGKGGPPPAGGGGKSGGASKSANDPADANQDGTVTQKEKQAYEAAQAAKTEKSAHAYAKTAGSQPPPPSDAMKSAMDVVDKIVDEALAA